MPAFKIHLKLIQLKHIILKVIIQREFCLKRLPLIPSLSESSLILESESLKTSVYTGFGVAKRAKII